ncbi:hypothetical protein HG531_013909 [Fusarium graminearum]|nr:hypothetical protein HG531_013909 [Fusarium graminearum]
MGGKQAHLVTKTAHARTYGLLLHIETSPCLPQFWRQTAVRIWAFRADRWAMAPRTVEEVHRSAKEEVGEVEGIGSGGAVGIELEDTVEVENGDGAEEERGVDARTVSEKTKKAVVAEEEREKNDDAELAAEVEETAGGVGVVAAVGMRE